MSIYMYVCIYIYYNYKSISGCLRLDNMFISGTNLQSSTNKGGLLSLLLRRLPTFELHRGFGRREAAPIA